MESITDSQTREPFGENKMALAFNKQTGAAQKSSLNAVKFVNGTNTVRIVGDILARYVYWVKGENDKNIPMECLGFNRDEERFDNKTKDWVKAYYPDMKCGWSYATQAVVKEGGEYKVKVVNLKKKLWEQIVTAAEDLGDPTDPKVGWDLIFKRESTGSQAFNVAYTLLSLKCKTRALNPQELEAIEDLQSMDEVMPQPTPEQQKEFLDRIRDGASADNIDEDAAGDFDIT